MPTVLLAEDDSAISDPLTRALEREGYEVIVRRDGPTALTAALSGSVALVLLDLGLPEMDGLEVCRQLRAAKSTVPVLVLTARTDEVDFVVGLDAGADDYVAKPFRLAELLARVRALLRRRGADVLEANAVRLQISARRVWQDEVELQLSNKEFELLRVLLEHAGSVVTREQIMRDVWDDSEGSASKTLDMHVSWLRRKLGDEPQQSRLITTVRGVGFRFERD
ncbi:MAG TPA: response regulator transcription factor [Mycobacteriales bacterium]|nr:response regulator transcription factor [Mycobacteriales bacterium]